MSWVKRHLSLILIVVIFLVINIVALKWSSLFLRAPSRSLLQYGARIPNLSGASLSGHTNIEIVPGQTTLLLYLSSSYMQSRSIELAKYAEILRERYGAQGLKVAAIVEGEIPDLRNLLDHSLIHYDIISDTDRQLGEKLGLDASVNGVFLIDSSGICRFSTHNPIKAEDLRQLIAVDFLHVDPMESAALGPRSLKEGMALSLPSLIDARSWRRTAPESINPGTAKLFVLFTANCSVCSLPEYLEQLTQFERQRGPEVAQRESTVLVFDFNFSPSDVLDQLKSHHLDMPAYIASEELVISDEIQHVSPFSDGKVVAVQTNNKGTISRLTSLASLMGRSLPSATSSVESSLTETNSNPLVFKPKFSDIPLVASDLATQGGRYLISDFKGNRVLIVKENMEIEREIGRIGSGPGRFLHPGCVDTARDGTIFVEDGGNDRVEIFTPEGSYAGEFRATDHEGFAVGSHKEIYLGQPEEGYLVTAYSMSGKKLRSFGPLKKFSDIYGSQFADQDESYKIAINRVRLTVDGEGNLFVSFMLAPLLQKYSPDGALLFEQRLQAPEIEALQQAIHRIKYISTMRDGADARIIALDPVVHPESGNIFVPLVNGMIYVADRNGNKLTILHPQLPQRGNETFYPFRAELGLKGELLVTPFPPKRWYELALSGDSGSVTEISAKERQSNAEGQP